MKCLTFHPNQVGKRILIISLAELRDSFEVQDYANQGMLSNKYNEMLTNVYLKQELSCNNF